MLLISVTNYDIKQGQTLIKNRNWHIADDMIAFAILLILWLLATGFLAQGAIDEEIYDKTRYGVYIYKGWQVWLFTLTPSLLLCGILVREHGLLAEIVQRTRNIIEISLYFIAIVICETGTHACR